MATAVSNNRKMILTTVGVLAFGVAAYGLGRIYPPLGPSSGTVGPAQRYVSAQVGEGDVTLGDTSVPQLMQTDAFEVMVHDANFRAAARDPNFAALAANPAALASMAANARQFESLARNPQAFANMVQVAQAAGANAHTANASSAQAAAIM